MKVGDGLYLVISAHMKMPYQFTKIQALIQKFSKAGIELLESDFLKIAPQDALFETIWEGVESFCEEEFQLSTCEKFVFSSVYGILPNGIPIRISVEFYDEVSYEILIVAANEKLIELVSSVEAYHNAVYFEQLGILLFEAIDPLYGTIGIERSAPCLKGLLTGEELLPAEHAYYTEALWNELSSKGLLSDATFLKKIEGKGGYFRKGRVDQYIPLDESKESAKFHDALGESLRKL